METRPSALKMGIGTEWRGQVMRHPASSPDYAFLRGGGEMGRLIRQHAWGLGTLGSPDIWPQSLRVAIRLLLSSDIPMVVWWSQDLVHFHNDAFVRALGPRVASERLGIAGTDRTDPGWTAVYPVIQSVMNGGGAVAGFDEPYSMDGTDQDLVYLDFNFCPIDKDDGIGGVLAIIRNVSEEHADDERMTRESVRLVNLFEQCPGFICVFSGPEHIFEFFNLEYRTLMGDRNYIGRPVRDVLPDVSEQGFFELLDEVYRTGKTYVGKDVLMRFRPYQTAGLMEVTLDFVYKALIDASGKVYGIFVEGTYRSGGPSKGAYRSEEVSKTDEGAVPHLLTAREREVLGWLAIGKTAGETGTIMQISKRTCEAHIHSAARKLDAVNGIQTVVEALRRGELKL